MQDPRTLVVGEPGTFITRNDQERGVNVTDVIIKQYLDAYDGALATFNEGKEKLTQKYDEQRRTLGYLPDEFYDELNVLESARNNTRREAWEVLDTSEDKLVKFIYAECKQYMPEASKVLRELPATYTQLEEFADGQGWCGTWNTFLDRAVAAGAVKIDELPQRYAVRTWLTNGYGMHRENVTELMKRVDAYAGAAVNAALEAHGIKAVEAVVDPETVNVSQV
jgi:hypothetical protein